PADGGAGMAHFGPGGFDRFAVADERRTAADPGRNPFEVWRSHRRQLERESGLKFGQVSDELGTERENKTVRGQRSVARFANRLDAGVVSQPGAQGNPSLAALFSENELDAAAREWTCRRGRCRARRCCLRALHSTRTVSPCRPARSRENWKPRC